jgi:hypothetical protein
MSRKGSGGRVLIVRVVRSMTLAAESFRPVRPTKGRKPAREGLARSWCDSDPEEILRPAANKS